MTYFTDCDVLASLLDELHDSPAQHSQRRTTVLTFLARLMDVAKLLQADHSSSNNNQDAMDTSIPPNDEAKLSTKPPAANPPILRTRQDHPLPCHVADYPYDLTTARKNPEKLRQELDEYNEACYQRFMESRRKLVATILEDRQHHAHEQEQDEGYDEPETSQRQNLSANNATTRTAPPPPPTHPKAHAAHEMLLRAHFARLGARQRAWTIYSPRTSTRASVALRTILTQGDAELKLPARAFATTAA